MTRLIDDYLRDVENSLRVDAHRRRQIVDELRSHLTEKADELAGEDPLRSRFDIEQDVLRQFGNPRDLALAYEPEGAAVLTNAAGDIVLRLGKAVGRGAAAVGRSTGTFLKWTAVALGVLLILSIGVGAWAYYEVKPYIPSIIEQSEPTYQYYERCADTPCSGAPPPDTFFVRPDAQSVRFDLNTYSVRSSNDRDLRLGNGTLHVVVTDPLGNVRFDRSFNMTDDASVHQEVSWAAEAGNWTIAYRFDGFLGAIDVQTYALGFPWRE